MRLSSFAFLLAASAAPALAETAPPPVPALPQAPTHIRQATYSQLQRTNIVGVVGQPVTITFPKGEEVYRVVQSARPGADGTLADAGWQAPKPEEIKEQPLGNVVPLWPAEPGTSMLTITTKVAADGSQKVYAFRLVARAADAGAEDAPDVVQNLIFTGTAAATPVQQQAAAAAWWTKKHADDAAKALEKLRADALTASAETCHYTAKGKRRTTIEPRCPMDNGEWTFMRFPGLSKKPAVYVVTGDNEERLARQHGAGDFVVVEEIAARFRLRLGNEVLDVINGAYDPHGQPTNTGTIVPGVVRDIIQAKKPVSTSLEEVDDDAVPLWRQPAVRWIALAVVVVVGFVFWRGTPPPKEDEPAKPAQAFIADVTPFKPALPQPDPTGTRPAAPAPAVATAPVVQPALPSPAPVPTVRVTPQGPAIGSAKPTRPLMLSYAAPLAAQAPAPGTGAPGARPAAPPTTVAFKGGEIPGVKASAAIDTTYVLMPGLLPCVLDTAISSDVPSGSLMCHTPGPVYSPKGVLLMEADTQIVGRYEGLKNGGNRLQAVSTYAVTPNGIFVPITDNMSDDLGRTGLDGNVDHRYIERFGAAIALTLTQSVLSVLQAEASQGGNSYIQLGGSGGGGGVGGIAEQILQSTINLPPIFSKPQGSTIAIFLSAPVDFSASYRIREAK